MIKKCFLAILSLSLLAGCATRNIDGPSAEIHPHEYTQQASGGAVTPPQEEPETDETDRHPQASQEELERELADKGSSQPLYTIDRDKPMVALTFDDGPGAGTRQILDTLDKNGCRATFFVIGLQAQEHPDLIQAIADQGSVVGNHTWNHKNLTKLTCDEVCWELQAVDDLVYDICGIYPPVIRAPFGEVNDTVRGIAGDRNCWIINWTVDTKDWKTKNSDKIYDAVMDSVEDGSIILCHDLYAETGEAMERVIPALVEEGYQLVTIPELLEYTQINSAD